jgi:hypothetical protein
MFGQGRMLIVLARSVGSFLQGIYNAGGGGGGQCLLGPYVMHQLCLYTEVCAVYMLT